MNQDTKLKLQAYLDSELSERESRQMTDLIERDPAAGLLHAELKDIAALVKGNELELKCPESREFYWSKIERAIAHSPSQERAPASSHSYSWLVRFFAPAVGVAVLLMVALSLVKSTTGPGRMSYLHEIETPLDDTSAISFHSQSAGVTVVWVQSQGFYEE